tara:strand:- start:419 stop:595 length:177 start_codon:yes stop_codon:yes gene_type:complete
MKKYSKAKPPMLIALIITHEKYRIYAAIRRCLVLTFFLRWNFISLIGCPGCAPSGIRQ